MHTHSERGSDAKTLTSFASIAQLVEQRIENPRVPGSIPGRGTIIRRALNRNVRGFFDLACWYCIRTMRCRAPDLPPVLASCTVTPAEAAGV